MYDTLPAPQLAVRHFPRALLLDNIGQLITLNTGWDDSKGPRRGPAMRDLGIIEDAAVLCIDGTIAAVGKRADVHAQAPKDCVEYSADGGVVLPGFVDSHTHPVFAEPRLIDFEKRIEGATYQEIAAAGGGIRSSVHAVRTATEQALTSAVDHAIMDAWTFGTTTIEMKSGYGLDLASELKSLRAIRDAATQRRMTIVPTFLGAHVIPAEYQDRPDDYADLVCNEMLPAVANQKLARFVDVFCESGAFNLEQTKRVLAAALANRLQTRLHICQFTPTEVEQFAAFNLASVDHMECVSDATIHYLSGSSTVATLLPGASYFLGRHDFPPARKLIDGGVAVALATDYNPGTSPTISMPMVMSIACTQMKMTPAEAITASTINGAHALRLSQRKGSIAVGKDADLTRFACKDYREVPYWFGHQRPVLMITAGSIHA
ncbi:MAG: imidazolonepropionase [Acidobacteriaceae bacterium]